MPWNRRSLGILHAVHRIAVRERCGGSLGRELDLGFIRVSKFSKMPGDDDSSSSSLGLSSSDSEGSDAPAANAAASVPKKKKAAKKSDLSFEDLAKHGYSSGPSVLNVPAPNRNANFQNDWSWSGGKRKTDEAKEADEAENIDEREKTRDAVSTGAEKLAENAFAEFQFAKKQRKAAAAEQRALSFSKKEKRKRDIGQASRGKSYVEEEKRLLRDRGVYSGFD